MEPFVQVFFAIDKDGTETITIDELKKYVADNNLDEMMVTVSLSIIYYIFMQKFLKPYKSFLLFNYCLKLKRKKRKTKPLWILNILGYLPNSFYLVTNKKEII